MLWETHDHAEIRFNKCVVGACVDTNRMKRKAVLLLNQHSPFKSYLSIVWRRHVKEGFVSLETIQTWIVYVCHSEGKWARQKIEVPLNRVWW